MIIYKESDKDTTTMRREIEIDPRLSLADVLDKAKELGGEAGICEIRRFDGGNKAVLVVWSIDPDTAEAVARLIGGTMVARDAEHVMLETSRRTFH